MLAKAEYFAARQEYVKGAILGYEAMMRAAMQALELLNESEDFEEQRKRAREVLRYSFGKTDRDLCDSFRQFRNSLAHGSPGTRRSVITALQTRRQCEAFLQQCLGLARRVVAGEQDTKIRTFQNQV
jgi:hypothetical protein